MLGFLGGRASVQEGPPGERNLENDGRVALVTIPTIPDLRPPVPGIVPPLRRLDVGDYGVFLGTNIFATGNDEIRAGLWGRNGCELTNLSIFEPLECWYYDYSSERSDYMQVLPGVSVKSPGNGHIHVTIGGNAPPPYLEKGRRSRSIDVDFPGGRPTVYYLSLDVVCFRTPDGQDRSLDIKTEAIGPPGPICDLWNGSQRL